MALLMKAATAALFTAQSHDANTLMDKVNPLQDNSCDYDENMNKWGPHNCLNSDEC
jgi:hypothetical protein